MSTATASVAPLVGTFELLDYRHYGALEEIYAHELGRLAEAGVGDPEVTSTGRNRYALTATPVALPTAGRSTSSPPPTANPL